MNWQATLLTQGASINASGFLEFSNTEYSEGKLTGKDKDKHLFCPLLNRGTVLVSGPDAAKFLQGQVTCDITALLTTPEQSVLGAHCSHQGRMRFSFRAIVKSSDKILLILPKSMVETAISSLKKYSVFSKIDEISDVSNEHLWLGLEMNPKSGHEPNLPNTLLELPESAQQLNTNEQGILLKVADNCFELCVFKEATLKPLWLESSGWHAMSETFWEYQAISLGVGGVMPNTIESFIPQMLNLQVLAQGISFKKGCYTGQEVVARMAYLGKLKKRMYRFSTDAGHTSPGEPIFNREHKKVGEVVISAPDYSSSNSSDHSASKEEGLCLLAVVNSDHAEQDCFIDENLAQKLRLLELPYAIPIKAIPD